ncbi:hypothetical protein CRM22_009232 [Opisthorchis felineus]|uniref:Uncharacterized protein n=1 Tax=Opisthorchis felineus TaxID=147828 RepID=A0A4S2LEN8_OPIFE|nr:hypothetical protein CRM22_009232 [Opisthorchis felineus]TGZ59129.1 hypothetical protein CRM22_009232 [Opisthorchis felineus]TGZ59130.1 hypothetical protein CRM22_009232 [Opisthorchis felineus]
MFGNAKIVVLFTLLAAVLSCCSASPSQGITTVEEAIEAILSTLRVFAMLSGLFLILAILLVIFTTILCFYRRDGHN